jgi:hypothetical protein
MKKVLSLLFILMITSCTTVKFGGLQVTDEMQSFTVVGEFETKVTINKFFGTSGGATMFNMGADAAINPVYDAIQREIGKYGGDAAVNIEISYEATIGQKIINAVTATIYAPSTVKITGTVVKY